MQFLSVEASEPRVSSHCSEMCGPGNPPMIFGGAACWLPLDPEGRRGKPGARGLGMLLRDGAAMRRAKQEVTDHPNLQPQNKGRSALPRLALLRVGASGGDVTAPRASKPSSCASCPTQTPPASMADITNQSQCDFTMSLGTASGLFTTL